MHACTLTHTHTHSHSHINTHAHTHTHIWCCISKHFIPQQPQTATHLKQTQEYPITQSTHILQSNNSLCQPNHQISHIKPAMSYTNQTTHYYTPCPMLHNEEPNQKNVQLSTPSYQTTSTHNSQQQPNQLKTSFPTFPSHPDHLSTIFPTSLKASKHFIYHIP